MVPFKTKNRTTLVMECMCVAGFELSTACMATGRPEAAAKQTKQRWRKKLDSEQQQRARKDNQRGGGARVRFGDGRIRVMGQRASREREREFDIAVVMTAATT